MSPKLRARCRVITETVIRLDLERVRDLTGATFEETTPSWNPRRWSLLEAQEWATVADGELSADAAEGRP